ncbi:XdhC/CoxI family protein [Frigidibacter albus]|uniref:XdhC/CoxI family protein n=1 Tax=Frigidibacter albus TaxID=1465486 RepID=A0A6L8VLG4_9RHOB|nr:XdhC family protein [Frigidibacter albus]MZQ90566.1 XdhC/CoxI family protein [Frigidibacter albus]NBE32778.1 XdhC/CoxI family protein [Frigidibacter albus]GGH60862.1 XdhC/CoxI family protein [Frigidibacter albus]
MTDHPTRPDPDRISELALDWHRAGRGAVLATVVQTWGSAPRQAGSQMVVAGDGAMMGSVSGGCVEGAVILAAQEALAEGRARLLTFGVSDGDAFAVGLACGGEIRVLVQPVGTALPEALLAELVAARAARQAVALLVEMEGFGVQLVSAEQATGALAERFRSDRSGIEPEGSVFAGLHNPPLRLLVIGAVHIAQALVPMARMAGFDPVLIDPRGAFGSEARFSGEVIVEDWPDAALVALVPDARTAVVTLAHDPKIDDPAILAALASPVFYLGCLGSTRTHAKRLERLRAAGVSEAGIARIHGPAGLRIGAKSPAEIAVSILAEIIQRLRAG